MSDKDALKIEDTLTIQVSEIDPTKKDELVKELQAEAQSLRDSKLEERFLWVLGFVILIDIWLLGDVNNWATPTVVFILELLLLIILARKLGVKDVSQFIDTIMSMIMQTKNPKN